MSFPPPEAWKPDRSQCYFDFNTVELPVDELGRQHKVHTKLWTDRGKLMDFVMVQYVEFDHEVTADVVVVDCLHGKGVHVHRYRYDGTQVSEKRLRVIGGPDDVEAGFVEAESIIYDHWEANVRTWERGGT